MNPESMEYVRQLVLERSAIQVAPEKAYLVSARLGEVARAHDIKDVDALVAKLKGSRYGTLHKECVEAMTTNETSFFRDPNVFNALKKTILPSIIESRRASKRIRIWSAASSTGQEAYSVAMILDKDFKEVANWQIEIVGTDLNEAVLEKARSGKYTQLEVNRGLPAPVLVKYFKRDDGGWMINDDIRKRVKFKPLNLIAHWPPMGRFDLVLIRNVLIYFDVQTKHDILEKVVKCLEPDGSVLLGGAETTMGVHDGFRREDAGKCSLYKLREQGATAA